MTGRRDLGLEFGREVRPDAFDALGYALMTCRDLGEAIALVPLYGRVMFDPVQCRRQPCQAGVGGPARSALQ